MLEKLDVTNKYVDVIGIVTDCGIVQTITKKDQSEVNKRDITLVDKSLCSIRCTLWDKPAEMFEMDGGRVGSVVVLKNARLSDYNGRSLTGSSGRILFNPTIPQSKELEQWYASS
jgi:replication factor A1